MSARALKKLQKDEFAGGNEVEDDASEEEISIASPDAKNSFNLLLPSQSESENKEEDTETTSSHVCKQKKKKRRKKKCGNKKSGMSSEDNEIAALEQYILKSDVKPTLTTEQLLKSDEKKPADSTFSIELKYLNYQYEMRKTFGKRVVKMENKRSRPKPTLKSTYIVTVKENRPPVPKELISMKILTKSDDSNNWFTFEHSKFYQSVEELFLSAVKRTDTDFLVNLMKKCPYHVDSLIQLSEFCKMTENSSMAVELIERAVLILESSLHPSFSLTSGNCCLDYRQQENRCFFIVLFKHAQFLEAKACCRTAFEISKLIFNLNMDSDPLAMVLVMDYYAIRSRQFSWMVKFYEEWEPIKNLSQLPNMAFSYALALFYLNEETQKADEALQYALLMFPATLKPLLEELSVKPDQRVESSKYFDSNISGSLSPALHQLVALYVCRAKVIWRDTNVIGWLERNVNVVIDRVENKDPLIIDYNCKRQQRYVNPPRAILRHIFLSDFKEKVPMAAFLAKETQPVMMYDPLPPLDSNNLYDIESLRSVAAALSASTSGSTSHSPFSTFLESILPNFQVRDERDRFAELVNNMDREVNRQLDVINDVQQAQAAGVEPNIQYGELRQSLSNIVDAMREFFSSMRVTDSQNADEEGGGTSDEDDNLGDYNEELD